MDDPVFIVFVLHALDEPHDFPAGVDLDMGELQGRFKDLPLLNVIKQGIPLPHSGKHPFQSVVMVGWHVTCYDGVVEVVSFGNVRVPKLRIHPGLYLFRHVGSSIGRVVLCRDLALGEVPKNLMKPIVGVIGFGIFTLEGMGVVELGPSHLGFGQARSKLPLPSWG